MSIGGRVVTVAALAFWLGVAVGGHWHLAVVVLLYVLLVVATHDLAVTVKRLQ